MTNNIDKQLVDWHSAFYAAARFELRNENVVFPTQIIVTDELDAKEHIVLRALTNSLEEKYAEAFIELATGLKNDEDKTNIDAVLQVSVNVNKKLYEDIKRRNTDVCEALRDLMKDEIDEAVKNAVADKDAKLANQAAELADKDAELADKDAKLADQAAEIARLKAELAAKNNEK